MNEKNTCTAVLSSITWINSNAIARKIQKSNRILFIASWVRVRLLKRMNFLFVFLINDDETSLVDHWMLNEWWKWWTCDDRLTVFFVISIDECQLSNTIDGGVSCVSLIQQTNISWSQLFTIRFIAFHYIFSTFHSIGSWAVVFRFSNVKQAHFTWASVYLPNFAIGLLTYGTCHWFCSFLWQKCLYRCGCSSLNDCSSSSSTMRWIWCCFCHWRNSIRPAGLNCCE